MAKAICLRQFWDGPSCKMYFPGSIDPFNGLDYDIDPKSLIAKYFEFPNLKKEETEETDDDIEVKRGPGRPKRE
jgi:hypothetical protein